MRQLTFVLVACLLSISSYTQQLLTDFECAVTRPAVISAVAEQADGKILLGGTMARVNELLRYNIGRINADGSADPSFSTNFRDTAITTIIVQDDQKILVGGYTRKEGRDVGVLFRLLSDGSFDNSFQTNTFDNRVTTMAILDNGRIMVGGLFGAYNTFPTDGLVMLNSDGTLQQRFDLNVNNGNLFIYSILAAGNGFYVGGNIGTDAELYRFDSNGIRDIDFEVDERLGTSDFMISIRQMAYLSDGNIVFTTYTWEFDPQSVVITPDGDRVWRRGIPNPQGLTITPDDEILVSGEREGKPDVYLVGRSSLTPFVSGRHADDQVYNILTLSSGKILIGGRFGQFKGLIREGLAMADADGNIDLSFSPKIQRAGLVRAIEQVGEQYLIGGDFNRVNGFNALNLARLNPDGSLDPTFSQTSIPSSKSVNGFTIQNDGKILAASSSSSLDVEAFDPIQRLNPNGSRDLSFSIPGSLDLLGNFNGFRQLADGRILVYGSFSIIGNDGFYRHLAVFSSSGTFDPRLSSQISASNINDVYVDNNAIFLAGRNISVNGSDPRSLVLVDPNGNPINGFSTSITAGSNLRKIVPTITGKLLLSGQIQAGQNYKDLTSIETNGTQLGGFLWPTLNTDKAPNNFPRDIITLSNGDFIVSNSALSPSLKILRANSKGELLDSVAITSAPFINDLLAVNDSVFFVAGSYSLSADQMSIAKYNLFGSTIIEEPVDTSGNGGPDPDPSIVLKVGSDAVQGGQIVCLPITAENFSNVVGLQFNLRYNPDSLVFQQIQNYSLPDLGIKDFGLPGFSNNPEGIISLAWVEPLLNPVNITDGETLFEVCFEAQNTEGKTRVIIEEAEAVDFDINLLAPESESGTVIISADPNIGAQEDTLRMQISSGSVKQGESICLDIQVENFKDLLGLQLEIDYDPNDLTFDALGGFMLPGLSINSFGVPGDGNNAPGKILLAWTSSDLSPVNVADGTTIFELCFTAGQNLGNTQVSFDNPLVINGADENSNFEGSSGTVTVNEADVILPSTDTLKVSLGSASIEVGELVCIPVKVEDFNRIMGVQLDINFDTEFLAYQSVQGITLPGLSMDAFGEPGNGSTPDDRLRMAWFDPDLNGVTLADGSTIFEVCFLALKATDQTLLTFSNTEITGTQNETITFIGTDGAVEIKEEDIGGGPSDTLNLDISDITITGDEIVCLQIEAKNFKDLVALEFVLNFDPNKLQYESAQNFNLNGLANSIGEPGVGNNPDGQLKVVWLDSQIEGVSLADGTVLFEICFSSKIPNGVDSLYFSDSEIVDLDGNDIVLTGNPGKVTIGQGEDNTLDNDEFALSLSNDTTKIGQEVCIPLIITDFDGIRGMAFDIAFDPNLLSFSEVKNSAISNLAGSVKGPGEDGTPDGSISFNWISTSPNGISLPDGSVLIELCFTAQSAGVSNLSFRNPFIIDANNNLVNFNSTASLIVVEISASDNETLLLRIESDSARIAREVCLDVQVENFDSILALNLDFNYDPSKLQFRSVQNINIPGLDEGDFELPGQGNIPLGKIKMSWFDPNGAGVSLDSGALVFQLCFRTIVLNGISTISIGSPSVLDAGGNIVDFIGIGGVIIIDTEPVTSTKQSQQSTPLFKLYPVPTESILNVEWLGELGDIKDNQLRIIDVLGRPVYQSQGGDQINRIRVENLAPGMYQVQAIIGQQRWTQSFIKM